jgi:hypothetical protein
MNDFWVKIRTKVERLHQFSDRIGVAKCIRKSCVNSRQQNILVFSFFKISSIVIAITDI